jgi:hypothetical protein
MRGANFETAADETLQLIDLGELGRPLRLWLGRLEQLVRHEQAADAIIPELRADVVEISRALPSLFPCEGIPADGRATAIARQVLGFLDRLEPANRDDALSDAILKVAERLDADATKPSPNYHNIAHFFETALSTLTLAVIDHATTPGSRMTPSGIKLMFLAGLAHDLDHPGQHNHARPDGSLNRFEYEDASYKALDRLLAEVGLSQRQMSVLRTLVRATSPDGGTAVVDEAVAYHQSGKDSTVRTASAKRVLALGDPDLIALQEALFADGKLTLYAECLTKGDITTSILAPDIAARNSGAFHDEYADASPDRKRAFVDATTRKPLAKGFAFFLDTIVGTIRHPATRLFLEEPMIHTRAVIVDDKPAYPNEAIPRLNEAPVPLPYRLTGLGREGPSPSVVPHA